jgi:hypothetical protein
LRIIRLGRIGSLHRPRRHICLEGFGPPEADHLHRRSDIRLRRTGWSDPVARRDLHPLKTNTFTRRTPSLTPRSAAIFVLANCQQVDALAMGRAIAHIYVDGD